MSFKLINPIILNILTVTNIYIGYRYIMRRSYKGLFKPTHPKKYVGNTNMIVYRSLLERKFMRYCDNNDDILFWASEELPIRYYNPLDKKYHRYFPDFVIKTTNNERFVIEIKPSRQVEKPKTPKRKTKSYMRESFQYIKNQAKWQAARKYCDDKGMEFKLITEKDLGKY